MEQKETEPLFEKVDTSDIPEDIKYIANTIGFNLFRSEMITDSDGHFYLDGERTQQVFLTAAKVYDLISLLGYKKG